MMEAQDCQCVFNLVICFKNGSAASQSNFPPEGALGKHFQNDTEKFTSF